MDVAGFIQNFGDALMTMAILGYWLNSEIAAKKALESKVDALQGEVKDDLRSILPLLQQSTELIQQVGNDGNEEVVSHLIELKELIRDVQRGIN